MNAEMPGLSADQKEMRRTGIGGSEIGAICGVNPWATPLDVFLAKVDGYEQEDNAAMERGRFLEDGVAQWYAHRRNVRLLATGTTRHARFPIALCTPDRFVEGGNAPDRLLSIKVPGPQFGRDTWGEDGSDDVPLQYLLQLQWEHFVVSSRMPLDDEMHLAAPIDGDLRVFILRSDRELQAQMYEQAEAFWRNHIVPKVIPEVDGSDSATAYLSRRFKQRGPLRKATLHEEALALALMEAEQDHDAAELALNAAKNRIKEAIGEAEGIEGAFGRLTWRANKHGTRSLKPSWNGEMK